MRVVHYSVSQVRVAATCPRLHWFDVRASRIANKTFVSRIWKQGQAVTACGALFHRSVETFAREAGRDPGLVTLVERSGTEAALQREFMQYVNTRAIDLEALRNYEVPERKAFITAIERYTTELAELVAASLAGGITPHEVLEDLFGDQRKRVDVTFHLPCDVPPVHVSGAVDHVYWDAARGRHRLIDYKLTPATAPTNDLFQVSIYALMHDHQHGTRPDVALHYLHPTYEIREKRWEDVHAERGKIYDLLASMVAWGNYDAGRHTGTRPPGELAICSGCKHDRSGACDRLLGPKTLGERLQIWPDHAPPTQRPDVELHEPNAETPVELEEIDLCEQPDADIIAAAESERLGLRPEPDAWVPPVEDEPLRTRGLVLGVTLETGVPVQLPVGVLNTHVAVIGAAGSGKTWTAKVIAEEAIRLGVPVLAIDPQGDLVQFLRQRGEHDIDPAWREPYRELVGKLETRVFTPGTSHARRLALQPLRSLSAESLTRIGDEQRRREEYAAMLSNVASNLVGLCGVGSTAPACNFVYRVLESLFRSHPDGLALGLVSQACLTPDEFGIDDADLIIPKAARTKLAQALYGLTIGASAGLFHGGEPLDMQTFVQPGAHGKVPLNVIYLNALTNDAEKQFFVAALAAEIYRWMVCELEAGGRTNLLVYLDEARDYIPAGTAQPPAKAPLVRLFSQGRKYGVACLVCTQSPRSVDYNVFSNASTKVIGRLESAQDVDRVVEWFSQGGGAPKWIAGRKAAAPGSFVARWPAMPDALEGRAFTCRGLFSLHEGAWSPERLEREVRRT